MNTVERKLQKIKNTVDKIIADQKAGKIKLSRNIGRMHDVFNDLMLLKAMLYYSEIDRKSYIENIKRIEAAQKEDKKRFKEKAGAYRREEDSIISKISNAQASVTNI